MSALSISEKDLGAKICWVGNKADTMDESEIHQKFRNLPQPLYISARDGHQVDQLKQRLLSRVVDGTLNAESTIITQARHFQALEQVALSLKDIRQGLDKHLPGDLIAADIRRCLHFLGEITGEITTEDQLDYIFSKFCIGK